MNKNKMKIEIEYDTVLWGFFPNEFVDISSFIGNAYHRLRLFGPIIESGFDGSKYFQGIQYSVGTTIMGYNGESIYLKDYESNRPINKERVYLSLSKKHPNWSRAKIERSVENSTSAFRIKTIPIDKYLAVIRQLKVLCLCGPVIFIFDDGGTSLPEIGGTRGLPYSERKPKMNEAYKIDLECENIDYEKTLHVPFWVPVTYFAHGLSKEFSKLKNNQRESFIKDVAMGLKD